MKGFIFTFKEKGISRMLFDGRIDITNVMIDDDGGD